MKLATDFTSDEIHEWAGKTSSAAESRVLVPALSVPCKHTFSPPVT
jgi:hypothetical protein